MTQQTAPPTWLTSRRLRAHGLLLGIALWSVYLCTLATPSLRDRNGNLKGTDFLHFYTLGWLAREHRGSDLYDMNVQAGVAARHVPDAAGIRYLPLYPPQVSILFAPFARLSYGRALALWWLACVFIYGASCYLVWRTCPSLSRYGGTVVILAAGSPAFFHLIAWGQTSAIVLALFTSAFFLLRERRDFLAGVALGCLVFKPQLGLAAAVVFILTGNWKIVTGAILSAAAELSIGVFYYGFEPLRQWMVMMRNVRGVLPLLEPRPYQTHCLRTFWDMLLPWPGLALALYAISAAFVLGITIAMFRRASTPLALRYSSMLLATVLVAPHLTVYDLVILAPALLLLADWLIQQPSTPNIRRMGMLLYLVYMLPLVGPLARWTHVQISVIAMGALLTLIWKTAEVTGPAAAIGDAGTTQGSLQ